MSDVRSLFERYGIKTPEQVRKEREAERLSQVRAGAMSSGAAQNMTDIENLMRGFGWQSEEEKAAASQMEQAGGMLSAISAIPTENMAPEVQNYYRAQLANINPELAMQFSEEADKARAAMLEASKGQYGTTKVAVPTYALDKKGQPYQTGTRSIDVPAKFVQGQGWVPLDSKYANATDTSAPALKGDLTSEIEKKLGIKGTNTSVESDKRLPADAQRTSLEPVSAGIPAEMPSFPVAGDVTYGGSGSGYGANEDNGLISYGGRNWTPEEFMQRFPAVAATMKAEGKL